MLGYLTGEGGDSQLTKEASIHYGKLLDLGDFEALYHLGCSEQSPEKAFEYFSMTVEKIVRKNNHFRLLALTRMGDCYIHGFGTNLDEQRAFECYLEAADGDIAEAQNKVGLCYFFGKGSSPSKVKAAYYFQLACDQGNEEAEFNLLRFFDASDIDLQQAREAVFHRYENNVS